VIPRPAILDVLPAPYGPLFDRLLAAVEADQRIRALWLSGSLARGTADAGSDLDVLLAVRDADLDAFTAGWRDWLATVTPTLIARELPGMPGCVYATTDTCARLDVVTEAVSALPATPHRYRLVVLDRDGLDATVPAPQPGPGPNPDRLADLIEEFLRQQAIFPAAVVARGDWLLGVAGVSNAHQLLYQLFVESNQPLPPMGVKQYSSRLTPGQRAVLAALPAPQADRDAVVAAMRAAVTAFRTAGRAAATAAGATWPDHLDEAIQRYFGAHVARPDGHVDHGPYTTTQR
jgi:nucleotidyltransferase-like protein